MKLCSNSSNSPEWLAISHCKSLYFDLGILHSLIILISFFRPFNRCDTPALPISLSTVPLLNNLNQGFKGCPSISYSNIGILDWLFCYCLVYRVLFYSTRGFYSDYNLWCCCPLNQCLKFALMHLMLVNDEPNHIFMKVLFIVYEKYH